jgi:hypothetical protein
MEDNFALRYVFAYPGIISRAELVPSTTLRAVGSGTKAHVILQTTPPPPPPPPLVTPDEVSMIDSMLIYEDALIYRWFPAFVSLT